MNFSGLVTGSNCGRMSAMGISIFNWWGIGRADPVTALFTATGSPVCLRYVLMSWSHFGGLTARGC